jgi:hypothetical protein
MRIQLFIVMVWAMALAGCGWDTKPAPQAKPVLGAPIMPPPSEWFPSLVPPTSFNVDERVEILRACGLDFAEVMWVQYVDLDMDRCNDAIVTLSLRPIDAGARGRQWITATFVFLGKNEGVFTQHYDRADIWFALVTEVATSRAEYDTDMRRQFTVRRTAEGFFLTLNETMYGNEGGDAGARFLQFRGSQMRVVKVEDLPRNGPLPLEELERTRATTQTRPAE